MGMARQNERSANNALSDLLRGMMHGCEVRSESTRTISEQSGSQPDILITAADRAPVVIEAEYMPAAEVEEDAAKRLGLEAANTGRKIEAVIALRYPEGVEFAYSLADAVAGARLSYCVLTTADSRLSGSGGSDRDGGLKLHPHPNLPPSRGKGLYERFPESGWLEGSVADVADLARLVSVPQSAVNAAASALEAGIDSAVGVLNSLERLSPVAAREVADLLGMSDVPQTRRMACAIVANAMVFHDRIAAMHPEILPLNRLWGTGADNPQGKVSEVWDAILDINYWPIFAVARDIVNLLPSHAAARILEHLRTTAHRINATGANVAHDLTGRVFQRLIVDRKYLATFYTLARVCCPAGAPRRRKTGRRGLVRRRGNWQVEGGRLRVRNGRAAVRRVRAVCHAARAGGRQPGVSPQGDDGGCPLWLRCDAVGDTHHRLYAVGDTAECGIRQLAAVQHALWQAGGWHGCDRFAGTAAIVSRDDALQHQRPRDANRQHGRGNGRARASGCTRRGLRHRNNEPALHEQYQAS